MLFEKNLLAIKSKYKRIYDAINDGMELFASDNISVETDRKGEQIVVYHGQERDIYLNSRYDAINEASKYMSEYFDMPDESILIMYGLSNGNYVREFIKNAAKNVKCIIYEPNIDIFLQVIKYMDIKDMLESDRVYIVIKGLNDEEFAHIVGEWLQPYNMSTNKIMSVPKYMDLFNDSYSLFIQELNNIYDKFYICMNTDICDGKRFAVSGLNNMKFLVGCRSGMELQGKFPEDMPAIVVSSGPSLEKNIKLLHAAKGKAFIFATDRAVSYMMKLGIRPDAMITIDPEKPVDNFKISGIEDIPLFMEMYANTEILDYLKPQNLFFFSSDSIIWSRLFEEVGSQIPSMGMGGSVATAAIANLILWGFKRIILIGQDLAFTGNRMYAGKGAVTIDANDGRYMTVKDINGDDVFIEKGYYIYLRWIEDIALRYRNIEFIDATEGGAFKKNLKQMTLKDAIESYCTSYYNNIADILLSPPRLFLGKDVQLIIDSLEAMKHDFENMKEQLIVCKDDCIKGMEILQSGKIDIAELKRININIKNTDELIEDSDETTFLKKYAAEIEINMMVDMYKEEKDDIKEAIRMYEKSRKYYEGILSVLPALIELTDKNIKQLKNA